MQCHTNMTKLFSKLIQDLHTPFPCTPCSRICWVQACSQSFFHVVISNREYFSTATARGSYKSSPSTPRRWKVGKKKSHNTERDIMFRYLLDPPCQLKYKSRGTKKVNSQYCALPGFYTSCCNTVTISIVHSKDKKNHLKLLFFFSFNYFLIKSSFKI